MTLFIVFTCQICIAENIKYEIIGIEGDVKKNVETMLETSMISLKTKNESQFYDEAKQKIKEAMQPFGYFKPHIRTDHLAQQPTVFRFFIDPGPALLVTQVDFKLIGPGNNDAIFKKIVTHFPIQNNQIFSVAKYNNVKNQLENAALQNGYFDAHFTQAIIKIDLQKHTAAIILHYETGPRYKFGQLVFNDTSYSTHFLKRFSGFSLAEPYDTAKLQTFQENLTTADYFKTVTVDPKPNAAENWLVPIDVFLSPLPRREYDWGLGYGTDTGPRAMVNYIARQLTTDGQMFKAQIQASQVSDNLQANYIIPGKNPATDKYIFGAAVQQIDISTGNSFLEKVSSSYMNSLWGLQQIFSLTLQHERWALSGQPYQSELLLVPSINWSKVYKDNQTHPTKGYRMNLGVLGAPVLFGHNSFLQSKLSAKGIYPVFNIGRLIARMDLGYTHTQDITHVPLSFDFFAGGTDSIRGYGYNSIGPGTNLLVASVEYRQKIKGDWYLATFFDAGNASNAFPGKLKRGVGLGPAWDSPVGILELTVARGLDEPGKPIMIQFSMGPDL